MVKKFLAKFNCVSIGQIIKDRYFNNAYVSEDIAEQLIEYLQKDQKLKNDLYNHLISMSNNDKYNGFGTFYFYVANCGSFLRIGCVSDTVENFNSMNLYLNDYFYKFCQSFASIYKIKIDEESLNFQCETAKNKTLYVNINVTGD